MDRTRAQAADQGYVETFFGRRLYLPEINSNKPQERAAAERTAINAPMQGTAADIIKKAMVAVDNWLTTSGLDARVILQVHDELVLEVREDLVDQVSAEIVSHSGSAKAGCASAGRIDVGNTWDEAHYHLGRFCCGIGRGKPVGGLIQLLLGFFQSLSKI